MQIVLKDIAEIYSGHTVRGRVENDPTGDVYVIQMKDLTNHYKEIANHPHKIKSSEVPQKQILKKGDILFVSKGSNNYAVVFDKPYPAVAVSIFFVIRLKSDKIDPYYLAWYINQDKAQAYLHTGKEGTMIPNLTKVTLENLEIAIPSLEKQKNIAEINKLLLREIEITETILDKKKILINNYLKQIL